VDRPSTLALVPARGGSKSIPRKNIRPLGGRPLIEYVLRAIAESGVVDRCCVTTDDAEIAAVARNAGADVPFLRPQHLATDTTPGTDVILHAVEWLEEQEGETPELVLVIQPTEPFVRPEQIREALALLLERGADSAITVTEVPRNHHPYHVRVIDPDGRLEFADPEAHYAHPTRQADPPRLAFANLYWVRRDVLLRTRTLEAGHRVGLVVDETSALDLNTPLDWVVAEALLEGGLVP
jgi:CMP-N-acetylneuraminic acid synthetase